MARACSPGQDAPIFIRENGQLTPVRATFGMLPYWAKGDAIANQTYSARSPLG